MAKYYIWKHENEYGSVTNIATDTPFITEDTNFEYVNPDGDGWMGNFTNIGEWNYSLKDVSNVVNEDKIKVDYNKPEVDWDFELIHEDFHECNSQELRNFSSRVGVVEQYDDGSVYYQYVINGTNFTTNPVESFKIKVSNCEECDGVYTVTLNTSGSQNENRHDWLSNTYSEIGMILHVWCYYHSTIDKWTIYADFTSGC